MHSALIPSSCQRNHQLKEQLQVHQFFSPFLTGRGHLTKTLYFHTALQIGSLYKFSTLHALGAGMHFTDTPWL